MSTAKSLFFYASSLFSIGVGPALFPFFVLSLILFVLKRRLARMALPLIWLLSSCLVLTLVPTKSSRFLLPALPAVALLVAGGIALAVRPAMGRRLSILGLAAAIGQILWLDLGSSRSASEQDHFLRAFEVSDRRHHVGLFGISSRPWDDETLADFARGLLNPEGESRPQNRGLVLVLCALSPASPLTIDLQRIVAERSLALLPVSLTAYEDIRSHLLMQTGVRRTYAIANLTDGEQELPRGHIAHVDEVSRRIWDKLKPHFSPLRVATLGPRRRIEIFRANVRWPELAKILDAVCRPAPK